jgi:hypothetical protein
MSSLERLSLPDVAEEDGVCASFSELGVISWAGHLQKRLSLPDVAEEDGICASFSELGVISCTGIFRKDCRCPT